MFICTAIASALVLGPVVGLPKKNTVQFWDQKIMVSERVLDRTICPKIEAIHPLDLTGWDSINEEQRKLRVEMTKKRREGQRDANVKHCKGRVNFEGKDIRECNLD